MSEMNWYVVRAVSGQEKKIKNYIENEASRRNLSDFVPQVLIPSEKIVEVRNGKKRIREKNFFPGYMIINADLNNGEVLHLIKSLPGVIGFLGKHGNSSLEPEALRQSEVNRSLGIQEEAGEETIDSTMSFHVGESVREHRRSGPGTRRQREGPGAEARGHRPRLLSPPPPENP